MTDHTNQADATTEVSDADILAHLGLGDQATPEQAAASTEESEETGTEGDEPEETEETEETGADGSDNAGEKESEEDGGEEDKPQDSEEQDEETGEEEESTPRGLKQLQKRVSKLTARAKSAETERDELRQKLEKAQAVKLTPSERDPLADLDDEAAVQAVVRNQRAMRRWCLENLEGGEIEKADGTKVELDAKEVRRRLAYAEDVLTEHAPQRIEYLRTRQAYEGVARREYPEIYDSATHESRVYHSFIQEFPEILRLPNHAVIIGDAIRGMKLRNEAEAARKGGKPASRPPVPKLAARGPKPAQTAPQTNGRSARAAAKEKEFFETGSKDALAEMIEATL